MNSDGISPCPGPASVSGHIYIVNKSINIYSNFIATTVLVQNFATLTWACPGFVFSLVLVSRHGLVRLGFSFSCSVALLVIIVVVEISIRYSNSSPHRHVMLLFYNTTIRNIDSSTSSTFIACVMVIGCGFFYLFLRILFVRLYAECRNASQVLRVFVCR